MARTYTISELESVTGIRRRTIHFYAQQGLLPAPFGTGGSARYGEEHFLRLVLIREMQNSHLKLSGIREALDAMSIEEMREIAGKTGNSSMVWDPMSVERWVTRTYQKNDSVHTEDSRPGYSVNTEAPGAEEEQPAFSFLDALDKARSREKVHASRSREDAYSNQHKNQPMKDSVQWERIILADGVELHVRSDRLRRSQRAIARLADFCRRLF